MKNSIFNEIRDFKAQGDFVGAWNCGYQVFKNDQDNAYLRTSLFWVCYSAISNVQKPILARKNKAPNINEENIVNSWIDCIFFLKLPIPCEELDYRFFNLFKGCGEHYKFYIKMLVSYGSSLYQEGDLNPYAAKKGEYPSLIVRLARQTSKAWLLNHNKWQLNIDDVLNILNYAYKNSLDRNKIWLKYDISKCLIAANRYSEARKAAILVLRTKMSESWAWGLLADTYVLQDPKAAIACYSKAILEADKPSFCIPIYFELAKLLSINKEFNLASASLSKLIEIYSLNNWDVKQEHQELIQQSWFDASIVDELDLNKELSYLSKDAFDYATEKLEEKVGIVNFIHKSNKGFDVFINSNEKMSVWRGTYSEKNMPTVGIWVGLKVATDDGISKALEVYKIVEQKTDIVGLVEGDLILNDKGFGFIENVFIPPNLLVGFCNGDKITAIKIWDKNPKTSELGWRAIKITKIK